jgi:endonuclease/exonuclease/phosphatase (EEP) superfamily protein YafD
VEVGGGSSGERKDASGDPARPRCWTRGPLNAGRTWLIWLAVIPVAVWAAIRVFGLDSGFPLEAAMAFTPYVAIVALLAAGVALALENWAAAALAALATVCFAAAIVPRTIADGTVSAAGHRTVRVLAANVHHGKASPSGVVELVDSLHPEILTIEELTPRFARQLDHAGLSARLPHSDIYASPGSAGTGIFSTLPLRPLPNPSFLSQIARAEATLPGGGHLRLIAVHPFPPNRPDGTPEWEEILASFPSAGHGAPWILAGDFNGTFDQAPFRELVARGYHDAGEATGKGLEATFPQEGHLVPPITIDHVLADRRLGIVEYEVEPLPGSDHRAVFAELSLP